MASLERAWRLPAEWEPHAATWLAWPHEKSDWPGKFSPIPWVYAEIVRHLSRVETVRLLVRDEAEQRAAAKHFALSGADLSRVEFYRAATDRSWLRDTAPLFVKNAVGHVAATTWKFNAWAKYDNYAADRKVAAFIARKRRMHRIAAPAVLEGGGVEVNGQGAMLTTEEWLLSDVQVRNPGYTRQDYERLFHEFFGVDDVVWLERGIEGDDTHGHIDDLARFVNPATVVTVPVGDAVRRLKSRKWKVIELPQPEPVHFAGQLLPASYANFYIANGLVLVPTFADPADREALQILQKCFPDRTVVGIPCRDLVLGLGTLHCMSMQEPA